MSAFTMNTVIERLEEEVEALKAQKDELAERLVGMVSQLQANRVASKQALDLKDYDISNLNNQLAAIRFNYERVCDALEEFNDLDTYYNSELKKRDDNTADLLKKYINAKDELDDLKSSWKDVAQRDIEIAVLKKQLDDQTNFMEKAITHASQNESNLYTNNAELTSHVAMLEEHCQSQANSIRNKDEEINMLKSQLANYKENAAAIAKANAYITDVLKEVEY